MTNYTKDNHLTYTIGNRLFGYRESSIEKYNVSIGQIDQDVYRESSWRGELKKTADTVYKEFGKDLVVFLSGGTDSEIVVRNFLEIGIKPTCAVIRFRGGYNSDDVEEAAIIANDLDLDLIYLDFDVLDFFYSGEAEEFGREVQCCQVTYLTVYKNILKLGRPAIMGGELLLSKKIELRNTFWYYTFREIEDASAMRFSSKYKIPLVNEWFSYTPEMMLYYLEHPKIRELLSNRKEYKLSSVSSKNKILQELYPEIRKKKKSHGFERLRAFNFEAYSTLGRLSLIRRLESSLDGIKINQVYAMLKGNYGNH